MERISYSLREMLVRQGIANGRAGTRSIRGIGDVASAGKSALPHQLAGEGHNQPMGNSGKGPGVNGPAKFTGLHVIVDNSRCMPLRDPTRSAQRGSGIHLVLV